MEESKPKPYSNDGYQAFALWHEAHYGSPPDVTKNIQHRGDQTVFVAGWNSGLANLKKAYAVAHASKPAKKKRKA